MQKIWVNDGLADPRVSASGPEETSCAETAEIERAAAALPPSG